MSYYTANISICAITTAIMVWFTFVFSNLFFRYVHLLCNTFVSGSGLGFVLAGGRDNQHVPGDNGIFVTKIIPNSPAHKEGTIAVGDRLVEVLNYTIRADANFNQCVCACIYILTSLSIYLSIYLSIFLSIYLFIYIVNKEIFVL